MLNIDVIDDDIVEKEEFLDLRILNESVGVVVENRYTHIRIRDFDSKCIIIEVTWLSSDVLTSLVCLMIKLISVFIQFQRFSCLTQYA